MLSRITVLSSISIVALVACATQQENPNYKYSSKYRGGATSTVTQAGSVIQTAPVSYETVSYQAAQTPSFTQAHHECLRKEQNRELLGAGLGGTIGAIAGKELIGGTKGTVIGAGLGGAAGYGIGDKLVNCDPQPTPYSNIRHSLSKVMRSHLQLHLFSKFIVQRQLLRLLMRRLQSLSIKRQSPQSLMSHLQILNLTVFPRQERRGIKFCRLKLSKLMKLPLYHNLFMGKLSVLNLSLMTIRPIQFQLQQIRLQCLKRHVFLRAVAMAHMS